MTPAIPDSYVTWTVPDLIFSHHPSTLASVTPVVVVKLHRPAARNGFTDRLADSLITAFDTLSADPRVRCVVLTSSDPSNRVFCVGMDFNAEHNVMAGLEGHRDSGGRVSLAIYRCRKPVIAAINGSAVGVGITMTLPADIRVVSAGAKVGFVFGRRGFNMEACSSFFLPHLLGASRALHLTTTGSVLPAGHRLLDGLFSEVVEPDSVLPTALALANEVASNVSVPAARVMKDLIFRTPASPEEAHLLESRLFYDLSRGRDAKEGISSFLQKREPDFKGNMDEDSPRAYPWWTPVDVTVKAKSKL